MRVFLRPTPASEEEKCQKVVQQALEERRKRMRNNNSPNKSPSAKTLRPQAQANASKNDQSEPMEEDANSLADSGGERAERVEMEATFSPDEEEDDHAAKDIKEGMGRTSIAMAMPMSETPQVEGIAATPAPKEMRPTPRRIHFAEEVEATSTTPATTRAEVHYLVLAPDPWFGPPPETPLKTGAVTMAVTNAMTEKI